MADKVSQPWSQKMLDEDNFRHNPGFDSQITAAFPGKWASLGENLAINSTLDGAHTGLMSDDRRNGILSPSNTHVGIGIARSPKGDL